MCRARIALEVLSSSISAAFSRLILTAALLISASIAPARAGDVLIFAAASQHDALQAVIAAYAPPEGTRIKASYQSSSTLARQIENGAPADIFISANPEWMDYLQKKTLIDAASRTDMFANTLVLVAAKDAETAKVTIAKGLDLTPLLADGRLALGDPDHVPAGIYAKQALQSFGTWKALEPKLARAGNVRVALALVTRGETPLGIVYASDAVAEKNVKVLATFPQDSHPPIVYPAAVTAHTKNPEGAKAFLAFLRSAKATAIFERYGFAVLKSGS